MQQSAKAFELERWTPKLRWFEHRGTARRAVAPRPRQKDIVKSEAPSALFRIGEGHYDTNPFRTVSPPVLPLRAWKVSIGFLQPRSSLLHATAGKLKKVHLEVITKWPIEVVRLGPLVGRFLLRLWLTCFRLLLCTCFALRFWFGFCLRLPLAFGFALRQCKLADLLVGSNLKSLGVGVDGTAFRLSYKSGPSHRFW